ncbi:MAG TPA: DUF4190 domain-containing protein [Pyrinomonadaceae bacterium]|nr:DUF4190 domain-containing protein [Pyrinomonadaceae bacterium]
MKTCPKCGRSYSDKDLNFCLEDGELLSHLSPDAERTIYSDRLSYADDPPPTEFLGKGRVTQETKWPQAPPVLWKEDQAEPNTPTYSTLPTQVVANQNLGIVALCLGVGSITVGWCCSSGFALSPAAIVVGFIALNQIKKDPQRYGGRGLAIGGIITGLIFLAIYLVIIMIYVLALLASMMAG